MKILIYGIKSSAKTISEILAEDHNFKVAGFIGNNEEYKKYYNKKIFNNFYFINSLQNVKKVIDYDHEIIGFNVGTSNLILKEQTYYKLENLGLYPINAISKKSDISINSYLGKGVVIGKSTVILSEVDIANNVFIGSNCTIEQNVKISNNCFIGSNCTIGSNVEIGRGVSIASGARIQPDVILGKNQNIKPGQIVKYNLRDKIKNKFVE